ncbi:MAG TPA: class I SAM-dependent methyltransferase [Solirubrobacterales bacterium]|nr:class I SAM-dependent methyltransferase [Solirubrobacterales bacterium]
MTETTYTRDFWEQLWRRTLEENPERVAGRPPSRHLTELVGPLRPGVALDAGCGHGSEALWLAAHGWEVTALDFSAAALAQGRLMAAAAGRAVADRIEWVEDDLAAWTPDADRYDLVTSLYVHIAGSAETMVRRMAAGVAPGGSLLMVGHRPVDPATGAPTPAAGQTQVSVEAVVAALDPDRWEMVVAEDRERRQTGTGVDAVIHARRLA